MGNFTKIVFGDVMFNVFLLKTNIRLNSLIGLFFLSDFIQFSFVTF